MEYITADWESFKEFANNRKASIIRVAMGPLVKIYAIDFPVAMNLSFKPEDPKVQEFEELFADRINRPINRKSDIQDIQEVSIHKAEAPSTTKVSHDWTDPTTWYQDSKKVETETLTTTDDLVFSGQNQNWINLVSGNLYDEDRISEPYKVKVFEDGVEITSGFSIDYKNGQVIFENSKNGSTVTVTYHYARSSKWCLTPNANSILILEHAELNLSSNVKMNAPISFNILASNPQFNPEQPVSETNPEKVIVQSIKYKNEKDIINAGNKGQGQIPAFGNLTNPTLVFPFEYATVKPLDSRQGVQLCLQIEDDKPYDGSYATASFYVISKKTS